MAGGMKLSIKDRELLVEISRKLDLLIDNNSKISAQAKGQKLRKDHIHNETKDRFKRLDEMGV